MDTSRFFLPSYLFFLSTSSLIGSDGRNEDEALRNSLRSSQSILRNSLTPIKENISESSTIILSFFDQSQPSFNASTAQPFNAPTAQPSRKRSLDETINKKTESQSKYRRFSLSSYSLGMGSTVSAMTNALKRKLSFSLVDEPDDQTVINSFKELQNYATYDQVMRLIKTVQLSEGALAYAQQGISLMFELPLPFHPAPVINNGWMCLRDRLTTVVAEANTIVIAEANTIVIAEGNAIGEINKTLKMHRKDMIVLAFNKYCKFFNKKYSKNIVEKVIKIYDENSTVDEMVKLYKNELTSEKINERYGNEITNSTQSFKNQLFKKDFEESNLDTALEVYHDTLIKHYRDFDLKSYRRTIEKVYQFYNQALQPVNDDLTLDANRIQAQENLKFAQEIPAIFCEKCMEQGRRDNGIKDDEDNLNVT